MFTGIVKCVGKLQRRQAGGGDASLWIEAPGLGGDTIDAGESIAVNGVCLTATAVQEQGFAVDVSGETLSLTTLGGLTTGAALNLERSLTLAQPLGGHLMSGHVDGVGRLLDIVADGRSYRLTIDAPPELARYIARKGSVALDGISLTVNNVHGNRFDINIVPHTWRQTNLCTLESGAPVNLEVDLMARYLERLLERGSDSG